jgi:hypothetical protein
MPRSDFHILNHEAAMTTIHESRFLWIGSDMGRIEPMDVHQALDRPLELFDTELRATPLIVCPSVLLTTRQGYRDALALIGEWWAGTLSPSILAHAAPYPLYVEPPEKPDAGVVAVVDCEWCGWTHEAEKDCEDARRFPPRPATDAEIAERRQRAVDLLGEPDPMARAGLRALAYAALAATIPSA